MVGNPNAESAAASACPVPITAEDTLSADRCVSEVALLEAAQKTMPNECPHSFAMKARSDLESRKAVVQFNWRSTNRDTHHTVPGDLKSKERHRNTAEKMGGVRARYDEFDQRRGAGWKLTELWV